MITLRKCLVSFAAIGSAVLGCNGLLGIDDGAYGPDTDSGINVNGSDANDNGNDGGPKPNEDGSITTDGPIPKTDAGNELLAQGQNGLISLVQDDDNLYWLSNGQVMTVPKSGGQPPKSLVSIIGATVVAVDPGSATTGSFYVAAGRQITTHPKASGTPTNLTTLGAGRTAVAMGSDGTTLVFLDYDEGTDLAVVRRIPKVGGTPTSVSSAANVALLGVQAGWAAFIDEPNGDTNRKVYEVAPPTGGTPTMHNTATGFAVYGDIRTLTVTADKMYWIDSTGTGSALRSHDKGAGVATADEIATFTAAEEPFIVASVGTKQYVLLTATTGSNVVGEVVAVQKGVAGRTSIVTNLDNPTGVLGSPGFVYVGEDRPFSQGAIQKIPVP